MQRPVHRPKVSSEDSVGKANITCQDLNMLAQPKSEASPSDGALAVTLMRHQRIALTWMLKETTGCPCFGGILVDDHRLGKIISTISLIVTKWPNGGRDQLDVSHQVMKKGRPAAGTLIVCPSNLMKQWDDELCKKVSPELNLSVLIYHGCSRRRDPHELVKYNVITFYGLVTAGGSLTELAWFRVVLVLIKLF